jgi:hypothetical protein
MSDGIYAGIRRQIPVRDYAWFCFLIRVCCWGGASFYDTAGNAGIALIFPYTGLKTDPAAGVSITQQQ